MAKISIVFSVDNDCFKRDIVIATEQIIRRCRNFMYDVFTSSNPELEAKQPLHDMYGNVVGSLSYELDEDDFIFDTLVNKCDKCRFNIVTCESQDDSVEYGKGPGGDNIVKCKHFLPEITLQEVEHMICSGLPVSYGHVTISSSRSGRSDHINMWFSVGCTGEGGEFSTKLLIEKLKKHGETFKADDLVSIIEAFFHDNF